MNSTDDPGVGNCASTCTLRDAVAAAAAGDVVDFDLSVFGAPQTITLAAGEIPINDSLFIAGPGADLLTLSGNHASRIFHLTAAPFVSINGVTIRGGAAADAGGAILVSGGHLDLTNSIVTDSTAAPGSGGGVYVIGATAAFIGSTISNNSADVGGGVRLVNAGAGFTNCTISGNVASDTGAGIALTANPDRGLLQVVHVTDSTIAFNRAPTGGGMLIDSEGGVGAIGSLQNSIVAQNAGGDLAKTGMPGASLQSDGFTLVSDGADALSLSVTDQINTDPRLAPLMLHGGTTPTHALLNGSPALDRGSSTSTIDQRGEARPVNLGLVVSPPGNVADIGAFEAQADELLFINGFENN